MVRVFGAPLLGYCCAQASLPGKSDRMLPFASPKVFRVLALAAILGSAVIAWGAPIEDLGGTRSTTSSDGDLPEIKRAREAFDKGKIAECTRHLEAAVRKVPALPPPKLMLVRLYLQNGKTAQGKALLEKCATQHGGHPEVYLVFGNIAMDEGRLTDAMLHFEKALTVGTPEGWAVEQQRNLYRESFAGQAAVSERREDWFKAQVALSQWSKIEPANAQVRDRWGVALFMLGREQEAFDQFQTSVRQDSTNNPPEVSMAVMYVRRQDYDKARQAFESAVKKYPEDGRVHFEYANMLLLIDEAAQAKEHADKAAEMGIANSTLSMQRGYIARQLGDLAGAEKHFSDVLDKEPSHFEAMNQLALTLADQKDDAKKKRALALAELNVKRFPKSSYSHSTLGWVYYRMGRLDEAHRSLHYAGTQAKVRSETIYYLARVLWDKGKKSDVRLLAEKMKEVIAQPGLFVLRPEVKKWMETTSLN
jgi:tetratricopeptide (TPR) repeat protein